MNPCVDLAPSPPQFTFTYVCSGVLTLERRGLICKMLAPVVLMYFT